MRARPWRDVGGGLLLATAALVAQWAVHVAVAEAPFAPYAVAEWAIVHAPGMLATDAIEALGPWARRLIEWTAIAGALAGGVVLRTARLRSLVLAVVGFTIVAAIVDPQAVSIAGIAASCGVAAGAVAGVVALRAAYDPGSETDPIRRRLVIGAVAGVAAVFAGGLVLRRLLTQSAHEAVRADVAADVPSDDRFASIAGLTPAVTSRNDHYVVDINLDPPRIDASAWRLHVGGLVRRPMELSLDDLRAMETVEQLAMLSCISNQIGGRLTGNARWTGVRLSRLIAAAGPVESPAAVRFAAADGYADTIPFARALHDEVLVAIAMDGDLLPLEHGFPARLLVPGLYGMKNVKWLTDISVQAHDEMGYWEKRGWDPRADVRTESRFDVPQDHAEVGSPVVAAGIAWAGTRGISRVEVSADDGATWKDATLEEALSPWSWRRWMVALQPPTGTAALVVRAYDGSGTVQDSERRAAHPSGASGYHRIVVTVRG